MNRAIFETVAVRLLIDLFPKVEDLSIDFLFVDVVDQTFNNDRRLRKLQQSVSTGVLTVDIIVAADIWPGEPENFNFEWVIETFFGMNFAEFLARLEDASNYFNPTSVQDGGNSKRVGGQGSDDEGFFTLPLVLGFATATVATIGVGALLVRRPERREAEGTERLNFAISYNSDYPSENHSEDGSFYSGIKPRRHHGDSISPLPSGHCGRTVSTIWSDAKAMIRWVIILTILFYA
jgi:hypothetical protein